MSYSISDEWPPPPPFVPPQNQVIPPKNLQPLPITNPPAWWVMTVTLCKIFFIISNQQASVAYRQVAVDDVPLLFSSSDQEAA